MDIKQNEPKYDDWYNNNTMKTINQSIGRVIRNKYDYGLIILIDKRY